MEKLGFVIWFTGLPAAGKSTLAWAVHSQLSTRSVHSVVLDSDDLRAVLTPHPSYTAQERDWVYGVIVHVSAWLARSGVNVLIAATAHRRAYRTQARQQIARFAEVAVVCDLKTCQERDPKGIYALSADNATSQVPGVGVIYEAPEHPEALVDTTQTTPTTAAEQVIAQLEWLLAG